MDYMHYLLTFTIVPGGQNCSSNAGIVVAAPDGKGFFTLKQHYGNENWVSYGQFFGSWDEEEPISLVRQSQTAESNSSFICWPVIDNLLLKSIPKIGQGNGVVCDRRYTDSEHFFVSQGNAAIELLSGVSTGIETAAALKEGSTYDLEFKLGDANNSCGKDFIVAAQAGSTVQNFTLRSAMELDHPRIS
ncbi:uncharacterized protein LOC107427907 [Ziziphus jujuba]|uniref:Uncharacterized protein LOC107427907 n=1 Tax=Ziziphus jujuba TaxID=326968 RepID=A0ABM3ZS29_ZIZJJ|nr:uncharacterized protein LOC107427907 [Ziziphus jujuba]